MANDTEDLKDKTLAQLDALRTKLTSADWQTQVMSCSAAQQGQNADLLILLDARIAQLEDVQFAQIQKNIDAGELRDECRAIHRVHLGGPIRAMWYGRRDSRRLQ